MQARLQSQQRRDRQLQASGHTSGRKIRMPEVGSLRWIARWWQLLASVIRRVVEVGRSQLGCLRQDCAVAPRRSGSAEAAQSDAPTVERGRERILIECHRPRRWIRLLRPLCRRPDWWPSHPGASRAHHGRRILCGSEDAFAQRCAPCLPRD